MQSLIPQINSKHLFNELSINLIRFSTLVVTLIYIFLIPFGNHFYDGIGTIFAAASLGLSLAGVLIYGTHQRYTAFHFLFAFWTGWVLLSTLWSMDTVKAGQQSTLIFFLFLVSMITAFVITSPDRLRAAYQAYVIGAVVGSMAIFYNYMNGIESSIAWGRYSLTNYGVDGVGMLLAYGIPLAAYLTTQYKNKLLIIMNTGMLPVIMFAIFLNGTRSASIVAMFGLIYWLFTLRTYGSSIKILLIVVLSLSLVAVVSFAPKNSVNRLLSAKESATSGTMNGRTVVWSASIVLTKDNPMIGTGIGSFEHSISRKHIEISNAHNTYIHILAELGIIGLALYMLILLSIVNTILRIDPINDKVFLLTLLLISMVGQIPNNTIFDKEMWLVLTLLSIHPYYMKT